MAFESTQFARERSKGREGSLPSASTNRQRSRIIKEWPPHRLGWIDPARHWAGSGPYENVSASKTTGTR